jgi:hypothetical protein
MPFGSIFPLKNPFCIACEKVILNRLFGRKMAEKGDFEVILGVFSSENGVF